MCGIAGYASRTGAPVDAGTLQRMTRVLAHRGPDGEGTVCRGAVGLGHRRLAIIDLTTGAQPMANSAATVWITFNGEIYNFRELRTELEARGFTFRTTSDTEAILHGYEAYGVDIVRRLRGMFAFAIWDERTRELLLARDRVGIKPLVYSWNGERFLFASELKALLEVPDVARDLDWDALRDYLVYQYVPSPRTIFRSIRKLPPASILILSVDGGEPRVERYWDVRFAPDHTVTEGEWIERLDHALADAVQSHMVSDVPVGAFLSGGIDSSTVVAYMARGSTTPIKTFSIGFDEQEFDELTYARRVAQRYGTEHYELVVKPDAIDVIPKLAWQFDEPFADSSAIPTYYVSKMTREHVTVALSGDGGDESFLGYRRYAQALRLRKRVDGGPLAAFRPAFRLGSRLLPAGARGQAGLGLLGASSLERYFRLVTFQRPETLTRLLTAETREAMSTDDLWATLRTSAPAAPTADYASTLQYTDFHNYLPDDILTKVDRASMLPSLESRVPLLDHCLIELAATIPSSLKFKNGRGKYILKRAVEPLLPSDLLHRPKMGFAVPLAKWFRNELAGYAREMLLSTRATQRGLLDSGGVARVLREHAAGNRDMSAQIWTLVALEAWGRTWWDGRP
jgi:asparagine synthase (glutamine-hydrolysing)